VLARSVADVAVLLRVIAGPDGHDGGVAPVPLGDAFAIDPARLRVALYAGDGTATAETVAALDAAAAALRSCGATVQEAEPPAGGHELTLDVWRSYGGEMTAAGLYGVLRRWDSFRAEMLAFAERHDLILAPVFAGPAVRHGETTQPGEIDPTAYTTPHSLSGWPAATVACGASADRLPIGVQVVAHPWRDDVALAAALELERALGGWWPPPL
jgi:amidase